MYTLIIHYFVITCPIYLFCCIFLDDITCIRWTPDGQHLASAGGEDHYIRLWHNTAGMREQIKEIKGKIGTATSEPLKVGLIFLVHLLLP